MTKHQLAYRKALIDKGLPEVYAHMAAVNFDHALSSTYPPIRRCLSMLVGGYFFWELTPEGEFFWNAIYKEAQDHDAH
jgi:hypothetical protein